MRTSRFRHVATVGALALIGTAPLAACAAEPLAPLPAQAASAGPTGTAGHSQAVPPPGTPATTGSSPPGVAGFATRPAPAPAGTRPPTRATPRPSASSSCFGAVRYDLDLQSTVLDLQTSMCFHTGGVLRLKGIGPGLVTSTPAALRSQSYEAGVQDIRFLRPGTVTVTIPQDEQTYTITVVVVD
jgi:hypothetical protein